MSNKYRIYITCCLLTVCSSIFAQVEEPVILDKTDSLFIAPEEKKPGKKSATNDSLDLSRYVMETRYRYGNEPFNRSWKDNFYLQGGGGMKRIIPCAGSKELTPLTMLNFYAGKYFNPFNALRLGVYFGTGYQNSNGRRMSQFGLALDHVFDWSAFTRGYRPTRTLSVSSVLGISADYDHFNGKNSVLYDAHIGAQFRLYMGNKSYVNIEPYFSVAKNNLDINAELAAWRNYNLQYGVNVSMATFLDNKEEYRNDSLGRKTNRAPYFFEYGIGGIYNFGKKEMLWARTIGHITQISVGKWLSPSLGVRFSYSMMQTQWKEATPETPDDERAARYANNIYHTVHSNFFFDVLLNPLGFRKQFDYNDRFGFNLILGVGGFGWLSNYTTEDATYHTSTFSGGVQGWYRLTDGLRCFLEGRYSHHTYHVLSGTQGGVFADNNVNLNVGVSVMLRPMKYRKEYNKEFDDSLRHFFAGAGCGGSFNLDRYTYDEGYNPLNWSMQAYIGYRFTPVHGLRLGYDFSSHNHYTVRRDKAIISNVSDREDGGYSMNTRNVMGSIFSLSYDLNVTNALMGYDVDRRWNVEMLAGPSLSMLYRVSMVYYGDRARFNSETDGLKRYKSFHFRLGGHVGLKLSYRINRLIGVYISPMFFVAKSQDLSSGGTATVYIGNTQFTQNLNAGVEFNF